MGFFDKAKGFFGGKNMATVSITTIERQPAQDAAFPVGDSVLKGTMLVTANQPCEILATKYEVSLRTIESGIAIDDYLGSAFDPEPHTSYGEGCLILPIALSAGQTIEQHFMVDDLDINKLLQGKGLSVEEALARPNVQLVVKCIADVKGSPFDPSSETIVRMVS